MLSIIIPTYKEERYIGKTLADLRTKMTIPHEVIVSDDASTDRTVEVARKDAGLVLTTEHKHASVAANRNNGAKYAKGDILVFMDADSTIDDPDNFFTEALSYFDKYPDLLALTVRLGVWPELETWGDRLVYSIFNAVHYIKNNIFHTGEASGKFQMIRKTAFDAVRGFREDLITREDADMFIRLSKIGRTAYIHRLIVRHTGRRAHRLGWPRLLTTWMIETLWVALFDKSRVKEWKDIR